MNSNDSPRLRFERIAREYHMDLYRYALWLCKKPALAKDLVQEAFLRGWKAIDSLEDESKAKSWLITIVRREYARTFERKVPPIDNIEDVVVEEDDELAPDDRHERRLIRRRMAGLPEKYREPLAMQVLMGCSCREIAEAMDISEGAVMTRVFRAREKLKDALQWDDLTGRADRPIENKDL